MRQILIPGNCLNGAPQRCRGPKGRKYEKLRRGG